MEVISSNLLEQIDVVNKLHSFIISRAGPFFGLASSVVVTFIPVSHGQG